jgi:hypothetical protein
MFNPASGILTFIIYTGSTIILDFVFDIRQYDSSEKGIKL